MNPGAVIAAGSWLLFLAWLGWECWHAPLLDDSELEPDEPDEDDFDAALIRAGLALGSPVPNDRWRS